MAATNGRNFKISRGGTPIAGVRTKTATVNGEPVDVTTDDANGFRTLLGEPGEKSIDLSVEGVTTDADLRTAILTNTSLMLADVSLEYANGDSLAGDFFLASLEETGTYNESVTFTAELQSSGPWVFTPAGP